MDDADFTDTVVRRLGALARPNPPSEGPVAYVLNASLPHYQSGYTMRSQALLQALGHLGANFVAITRPGFPQDHYGLEHTPWATQPDQVDGVKYLNVPSLPICKGDRFGPFERAARALEITFDRIRPRFVVAASDYHNAIPAFMAARACGLPFAYEVRGFWEVSRLSTIPGFAATRQFRDARRLEGAIARAADLVFTLATPMRDHLLALGVDRDRIHLVPNGCEPGGLSPQGRDAALAAGMGLPDQVPVIGYVGSLVDYEGLDDLIHACGGLRRQGKIFRLVIIGGENLHGPDQPVLQDRLQRLVQVEGLVDWAHFPGRVPRDQVGRWYTLIDIAPFPRRDLPVCRMVSPMKPLEAMALGKAVVVPALCALTDIVTDGTTGLVYTAESPEALRESLGRLVDNPKLRDDLGKAARDWVSHERTWGHAAVIMVEALGLTDLKPGLKT